MTNQEIMNKLAQIKNGRYITLEKVKDLGKGIIKHSDMEIRLGVNYAKMSINEGKQTGSLPWGKWVEGLENLVIEHKGNYYLRVAAVTPEDPENGGKVLRTRYLRGGQEISKEQVEMEIGAAKMSGKASPVYNIKFENIVRLGNA